MKKVLIYFTLLIAIASCAPKDEELIDNANTIQIELPENLKSVAYPADSSNFNILLTSSIGLDSVYVKLDGVCIPGLSKKLDGATADTFLFSFVPNTSDVGKTLNFFIEAVDINGNLKRAEYLLYVQANLPLIIFDLVQIVPDTAYADQPIDKIVSITSGIDLKSISTLLNGVEIPELTKTSFSNPFKDPYLVGYTPAVTDIGQVLTFQIRAVDQEDNVLIKDYKVFFKRRSPLAGVTEFWGVKMGGQTNTTLGQFLDVETCTIFNKEQSAANAASIDIISYYSNSVNGKYSINVTFPMSGSASTIYPDIKAVPAIWSVRNTTQLRDAITTITPSDFNSVDTPEKIKALYENAGTSTNTSINSMKKDKLVVFKTGLSVPAEGDTYGVILVRASSGTQAGQIAFDYKICK